MNLCFIKNASSMETLPQQRKIKSWALKLIGLDSNEKSTEDLLEFISLYVNPNTIQALVYDSFNSFYSVFLNNIESFCQLIGKKTSTGSHTVRFLPLLDYFVVDNVYPCTTNDDLRNTFGRFGLVYDVTDYHVLPNSTKFSHVLSGRREISFTLPGDKTEIDIPINVFHDPFRYHVKKLCLACVTEGHTVLNCPDIEDYMQSEASEESVNSSDSELGYLIKNECIPLLEENSCVQLKEEVIEDDNVACELNSKDNTPTIISPSGKEAAVVPYVQKMSESVKQSKEPSLPSVQPFSDEVHEVQRSEEHLSLQSTSNSQTQSALVESNSPVAKISDVNDTNKAVENYLPSFIERLARKRKFMQRDYLCDGLDSEEPMGSSEETSDDYIKNKRYYKYRTPSSVTEKNDDTLPTSSKEPKKLSRQLSSSAKEKIRDSTGYLPPQALKNVMLCDGVTEESDDTLLTSREPKKLSRQLSSSMKEKIRNSPGVLSPQAVMDIILCDGRNPNIMMNIIFKHTMNMRRVDSQLEKLMRQFKTTSTNSRTIRSKIASIRNLVAKFK